VEKSTLDDILHQALQESPSSGPGSATSSTSTASSLTARDRRLLQRANGKRGDPSKTMSFDDVTAVKFSDDKTTQPSLKKARTLDSSSMGAPASPHRASSTTGTYGSIIAKACLQLPSATKVETATSTATNKPATAAIPQQDAASTLPLPPHVSMQHGPVTIPPSISLAPDASGAVSAAMASAIDQQAVGGSANRYPEMLLPFRPPDLPGPLPVPSMHDTISIGPEHHVQPYNPNAYASVMPNPLTAAANPTMAAMTPSHAALFTLSMTNNVTRLLQQRRLATERTNADLAQQEADLYHQAMVTWRL